MDTQVLDEKLERLAANADRWARLNVEAKADLLERVIERTAAVARPLVAKSLELKQIDPDSPTAGEEWFSGPVPMIRTLRFLHKTLTSLAETGRPPIERDQIIERDDGQTMVDVMPADAWDRAIYPGFEARVWMQPDVDSGAIYENMACFYRQRESEGKLHLSLSVGNVTSIPPLDVIDKMFGEGHVCMLQLNPVGDYLGPYVEEAYGELIDAGFLDIVYGGVEMGAYLVSHELVDQIHLTGGVRTHDAIAYGPGDEGRERKDKNEPRTDVRLTSGLGNISPVIVAPGPWSEEDLKFHAMSIVTQVVNNAGFNCNAVQVLITPKGWELREPLMAEIRKLLRQTPPRAAFYEGAHDRFDQFRQAYDSFEQYGKETDELLPWGLIADVDPADHDSLCFNEETFCGVMCETALEAPDVGYFLAKAVDFCNAHIWGNLNASLVVHPDVAQPHQDAVESAIADLEYGVVSLNQWPAIAYGLGVVPWGAYPGNTWQDPQSGIGFTHNAYLFDNPQKTVLRGPFRTRMHPPWFIDHKRAHKLGPRLFDMEHDPSVRPLLKVLWQELRG